MIVISNSSPIISLLRINELQLLHELFDEIYIPDAVYKELTFPDKIGAKQIVGSEWIKIRSAKDKLAISLLRQNLDIGESQAIVLAKEMNADLLLIDEKAARRYLKTLDIKFMGLLGILELAKKIEVINDITPYIERLVSSGFRLSKQLYEMIMKNE